MSIEPEKVAVCPECGNPAGTRAPSLAFDFWIRASIVTAAILLLGLGVRIFTSAQRTLPTPAQPHTPTVQQFLGSMELFGRDGTFDSFRACADGKGDVDFSSAAIRGALGWTISPEDSEWEKKIRLRMGVARTPYLYDRIEWKLGWPTELIEFDQTSTRWLTDSAIKPSYSGSPNVNQTYWLGLVRHGAEPERGYTLQLTWAAIWVAWSFAAIAFLFFAVLLHRWRHWKPVAVIVCLIAFCGVLAWPRKTQSFSTPVGLSVDQTVDFGLSLAEFEALAATAQGRRELAQRVLRLGREQFRYEPLTSVSHAQPIMQYDGVKFKGKIEGFELPPDAVPVFALHSPEGPAPDRAKLIASTTFKSFGLDTITKYEYEAASGSNPHGFALSTDRWGWIQLTIPTARGHNLYTLWTSRLAIDFGTILAIPSAVLLLRVAWLWRQQRVRAKSGACPICGYDLRRPVLAVSPA